MIQNIQRRKMLTSATRAIGQTLAAGERKSPRQGR